MCEIWLGRKKSREESQVIRGRRSHEGRTPGTGKLFGEGVAPHRSFPDFDDFTSLG